MRTSRRRIYSAALSLSLFSLVLLNVVASDDEAVKRITNYKQWSKVSQDLPENTLLGEPREFLAWASILSAGGGTTYISQGTTRIYIPRGVTPDPPSKEAKLDHSRLGPVFVNEPALKTIQGKANTFPEGSVIVREKPSKKSDGNPEALSIMVKRERGFNPDGGDWQFLFMNGAGTKVKMDRKTGVCLDCHQSQSKTDFIYPLK